MANSKILETVRKPPIAKSKFDHNFYILLFGIWSKTKCPHLKFVFQTLCSLSKLMVHVVETRQQLQQPICKANTSLQTSVFVWGLHEVCDATK